MALMSSRVWPRAPQSGTNEMSDVVDINNSISGARGVDNNNNDDDDNNEDNAINDGRGTVILERQQLRQGQLRHFGSDGDDNGDCGKGGCDGHGYDKEGDMVMRQRHIATATTTTTTMTMVTRDVHQLHKVKKHIKCLQFFKSPRATEAAQRDTNPWNIDMIFTWGRCIMLWGGWPAWTTRVLIFCIVLQPGFMGYFSVLYTLLPLASKSDTPHKPQIAEPKKKQEKK